MPNADSTVTLEEIRDTDFEALTALAYAIWLPHYSPLVGAEKTEYILSLRFTPDNLRAYIGATDKGLELLRVDGELVGYCSYAKHDDELKLEQLYLLSDYKGRGLGGLMLRHAEGRGRDFGCARIFLQVAKGNEDAIAVYLRTGFVIREAVEIDIGDGFVMDDYILEKTI